MLGALLVVACTCSGPIEGLVEPADGATGVPTNAVVLVIGDSPDVVLRAEATGVAVAATQRRWNGVFFAGTEDWVLVDPTAPLDPSSAYVVAVDGEDVSTFTTGPGADEEPPLFAGLTAMTASVFPSDSNCTTRGELQQLELDYGAFPGDMLYGVLSVRREGEAAAFFEMPLRERPFNDNFPTPDVIASTICGPQPPAIEVGVTYCAEVVVYDAAGNGAPPASNAVCATARACEPTDLLRAECVEASASTGGGCAVAPAGRGGSAIALVVLGLLALCAWRRRSRALCRVGAVLVLTACAGEADPPPEPDAARPIALANLAIHHAMHYCAKQAACCDPAELDELGYENSAHCQAVRWEGFRNIVARIEDSIERGAATYDARAMGECLQAYYDGACRELYAHRDVWGGCLSTIVGQRALGEPCRDTMDCAEGYCRFDFLPGDDTPSPIDCTVLPAAGEPCADSFCGDGLVCDGSNVCAPLFADGQSCTGGYQCASGTCGGDDPTAPHCGAATFRCDGA